MLQIIKREPFVGELIGRFVITNNELYKYDYYGKGSLSRSEPVFNDWYPSLYPNETQEINSNFLLGQQQPPPQEQLILTLQEAFYLSYGLGCLKIQENGKTKTIQECFKKFCEIEGFEYFLSRYAVYHFYRCRGWIVRSGIKYGCDYVLYRKGPEIEHAKYGIRIMSSNDLKQMTWKELQHHCRTSTGVKKDLVFCQYHLNSEFFSSSLEDIMNMNVTEILRKGIVLSTMKTSRFIPERDREEENNDDVC
ncbi:hypothetical protein ABK040_012403 [Willaertia magna]